LATPRPALFSSMRPSAPSSRGDLSVGEYCRRMKGMADALHDLGCPVGDRILVLNVLRGLNHTYGHLRTWITRQQPFPSFLQVRDDLVLEEITKGPMTGSSSTSSTALVATPPSSSALPATSLLGAPPPGPSEGGGGASSARGAWWWYRSSEHTHTSCSCWCALAIHQQPMVRAHLDVAIPVPRGAPPPQHQPAAMFTGAAPPLMPPWTPPAQPSPPQPWSGGWDQAALA